MIENQSGRQGNGADSEITLAIENKLVHSFLLHVICWRRATEMVVLAGHVTGRLCWQQTAAYGVSCNTSLAKSLHFWGLQIAAPVVACPTNPTGRVSRHRPGRLSIRASAGARYGPQQLASQAIRQGMQLFTEGDVEGSLVEFDRALELDPSQKPYLWQRGLSLFYLDRFEEGATQFRDDVAVNPNDTEESIWCYLCEAKVYGTSEARKRFLQVGSDRRPYMRKAYELFRDGVNPQKLLGETGSSDAPDASSSWFYAKLYAGLYHESEGEEEAAQAAISQAAGSQYALRSGDYMASVAKVHCKVRGWEPEIISTSSNYTAIAIALLCVTVPLVILLSNQ